MSLVTPQQSNHVNGSLNGNGNDSVAKLRDGFETMGHPGMPGSQTDAFDFWGLLRRRVYLIALFCIIGAGLGYLNYLKSPKIYSSSTNLLITTQAPPSIVNGNILLNQKNSIPNHSNLLASEMVLSSAISEGDLAKLDTFAANRNPVGQLKLMLRVIPSKGDSLNLVCSGANPDDLPIILNQVVAAYRRIVSDDSASVSEQTVGLVEALAQKMGGEKNELEERRLKLRSELDVTAVFKDGSITNPYARDLEGVRRSKDELSRKLSEMKMRREQLVKSVSADEETGKTNKLKIQVAAIEAREYLKFAPSNSERTTQSTEAFTENLQAKFQVLQTRIWDAESSISDLRAERVSGLQTVGTGHGRIDAIDRQISFRRKQMAKLERELEETRNALTKSNGGSTDAGKKLDELQVEENKNWIRMYHLALENEERSTEARLDLLNKSIAAISRKAADASERIFEYNEVQKTIQKKEKAIDVILDRLKEMNVLADNYTMTKIRALEEPKAGFQIAPSFPKSIAIATMLAGLLGLGLAFLVDQADMSYRSPAEVLADLNVPVVGKIPRIRTKRIKATKGVSELITAHLPSASESEAFRNVRTNLFYRAMNEDIKVILLTSPSPGDGKSTTAANLAISMAQAGKRVALVDADFRRPRVDRYFGEDLENGLTDVLSGFKSLEDVAKATELQDGLHIITAGGHPKNPGELVTSPEFREVLKSLRESYDFVIVDSPPVLAVSDSVSIASHVDGVYLVTRIRKGVKLTARKAMTSLESVNASMLGLIINDVDQNPYYNEYGYQYRSYAYYGSGNYRSYYDSERTSVTPSRIASRTGSGKS